MNWAISRGVLQRVLAEARAAHPQETCGLLLGAPGRIEEVAAIANAAADPRRGFELEPAAQLRASRAARGAGWSVLGHYHSHPGGDPAPSASDAARADEQGRLWLILGGGAARLWVSRRGGAVLGRFDPVPLAAARLATCRSRRQ
jgi:proteasome lid subunit RPN8/RPN11